MKAFLEDLLRLLTRTADATTTERLCRELERRHARGEAWAVDLAGAVIDELTLANAVDLVLLRAERQRCLDGIAAIYDGAERREQGGGA